MSINQAAIHYNLPYSSLYGRFKRGKYDVANMSSISINNTSGNTSGSIEIIEHSQENSVSVICCFFFVFDNYNTRLLFYI